MFNISLIFIAAIVSSGIIELIKVFLPKNMNSIIKAIISVIISIGMSVLCGLIMGLSGTIIAMSTVATIGLIQFSYNFILKLLSTQIELMKNRIEDEAIQRPLYRKQIEKEIEKLENGECDCDEECCCEH